MQYNVTAWGSFESWWNSPITVDVRNNITLYLVDKLLVAVLSSKGSKMVAKTKVFPKIALVAFLGLSIFSASPAYATMEEDQTPLSQEEIAAAVAAGLVEDESVFAQEPAPLSSSYSVTTLGGSNRYETSARQALYSYPKTSVAIVASGAGYADSICAAGLAGSLNCPIVLTEPSSLSGVTANALKSMGVTKVILLGSEDVASSRVYSDLKGIVGSSGSVERVYGADRYETQMAVYDYGVEHGLWSGDIAVVASAVDFADALSISPISFALRAPVFFCNETKALPASQIKAVQESGKSRFLLTGSETVTSKEAFNQLSAVGDVTRLGGSDRYATSRAINNYAVSNLGFTWNGAAVTSGKAPYDALGGGVVQGKEHSVLALMDEGGNQDLVVSPFGANPATMKFFGDKAIFSMAFKTKLALAVGFDVTDIEGFRVYIDAGHGDNNNGNGAFDPGASGSGLREVDLTRDLANRVAQQLKARGINSYVNTKGYYKLRQAEATNLDCGLFVSIHFNASGGSGTESYIHSYNAATGSPSLQASIHSRLVSALGLTDRGAHREAFAVTGGNVPATLLEICFIDNPSDIRRYNGVRDNVAAAIADGIAYL